ncbi:MAG: oligosaccharide flippase family protein [Actinobacteria bacterium]|nr:oligosaccharide flippase family protein [Actinomycetota bacterium]
MASDPPAESAEPTSRLAHARNVSFLAIAEFTGKLAAFVMFAVAARVLGPADFGQFSWSMNLALLLSTVAIWGFDIALIQLAGKDSSRLNELLSNTLAIRLGLTPAVLLASVVFTTVSGQNLLVGVLLTLVVIADAITQGYRAGAAVLQRQGEIALNLVVQRILTAVLAISVLLAGGGLVGMSVAYLAGATAGMAALAWSGRRIGLTPTRGLVSWTTMRELIGGSTALGLNYTLNLATFRIGVLMLGWLTSDVEVGVYSVSYRLFEALLFVVWSVDRVALPTMTASEGREPVRRGVHRSATVVFAVFVPYIALLVFRGADILRLAFGSPYDVDSLLSTQLLALALLPYGARYLVDLGLYARSRNGTVTVAAAVALVINVVLGLVLIPMWGANGAAWATLIAFTAQAIAVWVFLMRMVGSPRLLRAGLAAALATLACLPALLSSLPLVPVLGICAVVYPVVWLAAARLLDRAAFEVATQLVSRFR